MKLRLSEPNLKPVPRKNPFEDLSDKTMFALLGALIAHDDDLETMSEERASNRLYMRTARLVDLE